VSGTATQVYVVYEMMNEGDLEQHLAPTAPGVSGLTDLERLTVCAVVSQALARTHTKEPGVGLVADEPGIRVACASDTSALPGR
jgi:hypothetical protein